MPSLICGTALMSFYELLKEIDDEIKTENINGIGFINLPCQFATKDSKNKSFMSFIPEYLNELKSSSLNQLNNILWGFIFANSKSFRYICPILTTSHKDLCKQDKISIGKRIFSDYKEYSDHLLETFHINVDALYRHISSAGFNIGQSNILEFDCFNRMRILQQLKHTPLDDIIAWKKVTNLQKNKDKRSVYCETTQLPLLSILDFSSIYLQVNPIAKSSSRIEKIIEHLKLLPDEQKINNYENQNSTHILMQCARLQKLPASKKNSNPLLESLLVYILKSQYTKSYSDAIMLYNLKVAQHYSSSIAFKQLSGKLETDKIKLLQGQGKKIRHSGETVNLKLLINSSKKLHLEGYLVIPENELNVIGTDWKSRVRVKACRDILKILNI